MPIVGGFDPAGGFGYAFYDTDKPPAAVVSGSLKLEGDNIVDKLVDLRVRLIPILKEYRPAFVGIESPFKFAPRYQKKAKPDLLTGIVPPPTGNEEMGMNPGTISDCGQIAGAATMACLTWNIRCRQVTPREWQVVIPKTIWSQFTGEGAPKKRVKAYCDTLRIVSPNIDSRDAALIAIWTAGHAVELKMLEHARG